MIEKTPAPDPSPYDQEIDILKGFLTVSMILSHAISVMGNFGSNVSVTALSTALQLQSFYGFAFAFGFTTQLSYFSRASLDPFKIVRTILRIVGAFYVSAIAAAILFEKKPSLEKIFSILVFNHIPLLSEFIIAFALFLVMAVLLMRPIAWLLQRPIYFLLVNIVLLACTFLPVQNVQSTYLGLFIGTTQFSAYPVVQYFPLFLLGAYFAFHKIKAHLLALLICVAGVVVVELLLPWWGIPVRFPPSLGWILSSVPFVLFWYFFSRYSGKVPFLAPWLARIGTNSLFFLLISNLFFLTLPLILGQNFTFKYVVIITIALVALIYYLTTIVRVARHE